MLYWFSMVTTPYLHFFRASTMVGSVKGFRVRRACAGRKPPSFSTAVARMASSVQMLEDRISTSSPSLSTRARLNCMGLVGGEQAGHLLPEHPDKHRAVVVIGQLQHALDLGGVADVKDGHIGLRCAARPLVDGLVGDAAGGGDAGHKSPQRPPAGWDGHAHLQLVQNPAIEEDGEGVQEGAGPLPGQARRLGAHILLGVPMVR